jgi:hypothetical protein
VPSNDDGDVAVRPKIERSIRVTKPLSISLGNFGLT